MVPAKNGVPPEGVCAWRVIERHRHCAPLLEVSIENGFPRRVAPLDSACQHQGFLHADIGPVAERPAVINTDWTRADFLRRGGRRSQATDAGEYPSKLADHRCGPPNDQPGEGGEENRAVAA